MTQQELAEAAGIDTKTLYSLESGARWPIARTRVAISRALGWKGDALADIAAGIPPGRAGGERSSAPPPPSPPAPDPQEIHAADFARAFGVNPDDPRDPWIRSVRSQIAAATLEHGPDATGDQVFHGSPASPGEARLWDSPGPSREAKTMVIAGMRAQYAMVQSGNGSARSAGLTLAGAGRP